MAITIDGDSGVSGVNGSATTPALQGTDTNTGIVFGTDTVQVATGGSTRATVDSSGRLLVGTTSASAAGRLVVSGNTVNGEDSILTIDRGSATTSSGDTLGRINFTNGGDDVVHAAILCQTDAASGSNDNPGRIVFSTTADGAASPTERMRITKGGILRVGADSTVPNGGHEFDANSTNGNLGAVYVRNTDNDNDHCVASFSTAATSTSTSNILIKFGINDYATGSGQINANGSGQCAFGSFSDERLKENITSLPSQWDNIKNLRPVEFDFIESQGGEHQIGFIAQEFETVYPDAVASSPMFVGAEEVSGEERLTLTGWSKTEARLVKALQEAITKIETLETKVAALEAAE